MSLDRQPLGGSLDGSYNRPTLGGQADGEQQTKDQSYLDSDQDYSIQAFSNAHIAATDSDQHDGWGSLPPLANSDPYLQGSPYAQSLAAADAAPGFNGAAIAAPDSNIETNDDFTDWRVTT